VRPCRPTHTTQTSKNGANRRLTKYNPACCCRYCCLRVRPYIRTCGCCRAVECARRSYMFRFPWSLQGSETVPVAIGIWMWTDWLCAPHRIPASSFACICRICIRIRIPLISRIPGPARMRAHPPVHEHAYVYGSTLMHDLGSAAVAMATAGNVTSIFDI
jgi:hypothetical protein